MRNNLATSMYIPVPPAMAIKQFEASDANHVLMNFAARDPMEAICRCMTPQQKSPIAAQPDARFKGGAQDPPAAE